MTDQQYLNCILRQVNVKKALLANKGISACKIYMSHKTFVSLHSIKGCLSINDEGYRTFEGLLIHFAVIADDIIDVGVDFTGLTY